MANGTSAAVTEAARLNEIGFPEFTAKLITDTFDALVSANMRQTEAYTGRGIEGTLMDEFSSITPYSDDAAECFSLQPHGCYSHEAG